MQTMKQPEIRDLTYSDIPILVNWLNEFNSSFEYPGKRPIDGECARVFFSRFINSKNQAALIAEIDGKPVATLGFSIVPHPWNGAKILFKAFWYANKAYPKTGIFLLRYLRQMAIDGGVEQIIISSMTDRVSDLLEREGFIPCETNYIMDLHRN